MTSVVFGKGSKGLNTSYEILTILSTMLKLEYCLSFQEVLSLSVVKAPKAFLYVLWDAALGILISKLQ